MPSREVVITSKGFRRTTAERVRFDEIRGIVLFMTYERDDGPRQRERWAIGLALETRNVTLTKNLYLTKDHALRDARRMHDLIGAGISGGAEESIDHLVRSGRKLEAIALARRERGMTLEQAKEFVESRGTR